MMKNIQALVKSNQVYCRHSDFSGVPNGYATPQKSGEFTYFGSPHMMMKVPADSVYAVPAEDGRSIQVVKRWFDHPYNNTYTLSYLGVKSIAGYLQFLHSIGCVTVTLESKGTKLMLHPNVDDQLTSNLVLNIQNHDKFDFKQLIELDKLNRLFKALKTIKHPVNFGVETTNPSLRPLYVKANGLEALVTPSRELN